MSKNIDTQKEFIVTALKWRPQKFSDIICQEHISITLKNAIKNNRLHHAYLFSGPRGIGKTTTARILARAINCLSPIDSEPCNECQNCKNILEGRSLDVIEIDGASNNSVDDIRTLRENAKYPPSQANYKIYIIDEVHMLSNSAFNALLKILEEPPIHLLFIFATTEIHKVPATILSRCQRFDFRRIDINSIVNHLRKIAQNDKINIDDESLFTIAKKSDGSMRDAQSLYDQVVAFCGNEINYASLSDSLNLIDPDFYFTISSATKEKNIKKMLEISREVNRRGYNLHDCLNGLLEHFRNILTIKATGNTSLIDASMDFHNKYIAEAEKFTKEDLLRILQHLNINEQSIRYASQPRLRFEIALIQLAAMDNAVSIQSLIEELKKITEIPNKPEIKYNNSDTKTLPTSVKSHISTQIQDADKKIPDISQKESKENEITIKNNIINADILKNNWDSFVEKYAYSKYKVPIIKQAKPIFFDNTIILIADNNFIFENLITNKNLIKQYIVDFFGQNIDFKIQLIEEETKLNTTIQQENHNLGPENSSHKALTDKENSNLHPAEVKLIELFNAQKLISND